jgi:hypothetical protein
MIGDWAIDAPITPLGVDELSIAGGLHGRGVAQAGCVADSERAIAHAEVVIEGEILPGGPVPEDQNTDTGHSMPELPGYNGPANPSLPVLQVKAITTRERPILQSIVGPARSTSTWPASRPRRASSRMPRWSCKAADPRKHARIEDNPGYLVAIASEKSVCAGWPSAPDGDQQGDPCRWTSAGVWWRGRRRLPRFAVRHHNPSFRQDPARDTHGAAELVHNLEFF